MEWMYDGELSISDKVKEQVRSPIAILQLHVMLIDFTALLLLSNFAVIIICVNEKHGLISIA
jgi:hypothetical protein